MYVCLHLNCKFVCMKYLQVSTNGYISMGERISASSPEIPGTSPIVAPYAADINPNIAGTVRYTQFTTTDYSQMSRVSSFIRDQTDNSFYGTRMMVAEWDGVARYSGSSGSSVSSSYQNSNSTCVIYSICPSNSFFIPSMHNGMVNSHFRKTA